MRRPSLTVLRRWDDDGHAQGPSDRRECDVVGAVPVDVPMRLSVWGINGALHEELAERGTLGTRKIVKKALPGDPFGGPI